MNFGSRCQLYAWGLMQGARLGRPDVSLAFIGGLGDELMCTAPIIEWLRRDARNVWVRTRKPELFRGLDRRAHILPDDPRYERLAARLHRPFRNLSYSRYDAARDQDSPPTRHIIAEMCRHAGLEGEVRLRPHWRVTEAERAGAAQWREHVVIQTSTLDAHVPMRNKQWIAPHFQETVDRLAPGVRFVQLGSLNDFPLRGVEDLRGKTSLRETAAMLHTARGFLGLVGFLMHLARAVECPAVIIYGGRETPDLTGYSCNINLTRRPACSPCWQRSRCDFDRVCMNQILATEVVAALTNLLSHARAPLQEDTVIL